MRPRTELAGTEDVVLPPLARLALRDGAPATLSGTALSGFPRLVFRAVSSTGGETARSLMGETLLDCGRSGEDLRGPLVARPGSGFHCVSFGDGEGAALKLNFFAVIGVARSFAMSNGLNPTPCVCSDGLPVGCAFGIFGAVWPCCRGPEGVCGATAKGCKTTPPGAPACGGYGGC